MKLGINLLYLSSDTNSGSGKYTQALLSGFKKSGFLTSCVLFVRSSFAMCAQTLFPECEICTVTLSSFVQKILDQKHRHHNFWESLILNRFYLSKAVLSSHIDVLLHPFNECTVTLVKNVPNLLVIHDLFYLRHPEYYKGLLYPYADFKHRRFLKKAEGIVTVSDSVRNLLLNRFPAADALRIHIIQNAVSNEFSFLDFCPVEKPYLLSVGSHAHYKNTMTLLHAYNLIKKRIPHQLVLVGKHLEDDPLIQSYIYTRNLTDRVLCLTGIPDEYRNTLYRNASLLIFPSLSESFGRVPIEAALLKTPVLISDASSLKESTLSLLDSYSPADDNRVLAIKIMELLKNPPSMKRRTEIAATYENRYDEVTVAKCYEKLLLSIIKQ